MELLLYKGLEELKFLNMFRFKLQQTHDLTSTESKQVVCDWVNVLGAYNNTNDFSMLPHIHVKNLNTQFFKYGKFSNQEIVKFLETGFKISEDLLYKKMPSYKLDITLFKNVRTDIWTHFENLNIKYFENDIVKHRLQNESDDIVLYDYVVSLLTEQGSNFTLTYDKMSQLYNFANVKYQAFGSPFASWLYFKPDTIIAGAYSLEGPKVNQDFYRLNLNIWTGGDWLIYMPTTKKEFEKVIKKIEGQCMNSHIGFYIVFPNHQDFVVPPKYLQAKIKTKNLEWISMTDSRRCINRKIEWVICFLSSRTTHNIEIFH
ncbi:hypothetical protein AL387_gp129 [Salmon gill poxvirus]|uniref:Uncharacterized protein n=1 Tax=Salmon gill poxvirus TaxID=1680908 RepID=A0A0H4XWM9_9POXV|nr:hypothetical protein AL387_gp129 [Salmon gill poxvirus]AKR04253.1 hypothetical protein SGPV129 [Salmon gill poxvirus]WMX26535.1 hypothetical protein [Salmon gill poxvirus]